MKKVLFFVLAIIATSANAQDNQQLPDCLRTSSFRKSGYNGLVERMLLPLSDDAGNLDTADKQIWGFISTPSFSPEESVYCTKTKSGYKLVLCQPQKNIWYAARDITYDMIESTSPNGIKSVSMVRNNVSWDDVNLKMKVSKKELAVNEEQVSILSLLFKEAITTSTSLLSAQEFYTIELNENGQKTINKSWGLDGVTTMFFYDGYVAECWSPKGGKLKQLVEITRKMKDAVEKNDNTIIQDFLIEASTLTAQFQEQTSDWEKEYLELSKRSNSSFELE